MNSEQRKLIEDNVDHTKSLARGLRAKRALRGVSEDDAVSAALYALVKVAVDRTVRDFRASLYRRVLNALRDEVRDRKRAGAPLPRDVRAEPTAEELLVDLDPAARDLIRERVFDGRSRATVARDRGVTEWDIRAAERAALEELR